jgi:hypothetical protein
LSINIAILGCYPKEKLKTVDLQQNQEDINKLLLQNGELKKELEREQLLHKMLYKEWEKLNGEMLARENEVYDSKPKNLFYKYAFYVLLIAVIPAFYFLYPGTGNKKTPSSSQAVSVRTDTSDSITAAASRSKDSMPKSDSILTMKDKPTSKQQQPALEQPVIKSEEKKVIPHDSSKSAMVIVHKPVPEAPLTDDIRDSISSEGFIAYFNHSRNPFKKSSERYKVWVEGWNEGKAEAKKVIAKDSSQKQK